MTIDKSAREALRAYVARLESVEDEISVLNEDKKEIYGEVREHGYDVKALKAVLARRRKDQGQLSVFDAVIEQYELALEPVGTGLAKDARAGAGDGEHCSA